MKSNDRGGARTHDLRIKSPLLYQLSYPAESANHEAGPQRRPSKKLMGESGRRPSRRYRA